MASTTEIAPALVAGGDERLDVGDDPGRGLRMHEQRHLRPALRERARDVLGARATAPHVVGQLDDVAAERRRHLLPARAEIPVRDGERLLARAKGG